MRAVARDRPAAANRSSEPIPARPIWLTVTTDLCRSAGRRPYVRPDARHDHRGAAEFEAFRITENQDRADAILRGSADDKVYTDEHDTSDSIGLHTQLRRPEADRVTIRAGIVIEQIGWHRHHRQRNEPQQGTEARNVGFDPTGELPMETCSGRPRRKAAGGKFRGAMADVADKITRQLVGRHKAKPAPQPLAISETRRSETIAVFLMGIPISQMWTVVSYVLRQRMAGNKRYPLVLMLEPLFRCNLACAGCGKIQYPAHVLKMNMTPEQCFQAVDECGAPMVSIPGGEPLMHPEIDQIVEGLIARKKYIYLCTNALLLKEKLHLFKPSKYLTFSVHVDGEKEHHDFSVCKEGGFELAVDGIREAVAKRFPGHHQHHAFRWRRPEERARFLR